MSLNRQISSSTPDYASLRKKYRSGRGFDVCFSLRNNYVFFPIGKVANSSIKWALYKAEGNKIRAYEKKWKKHERLVHDQFFGPLLTYFQLEAMPDLVDKAIFGDKFFRFAFVRSPYSRLLAAYLDRASTKGTTLHKALFKEFNSTEIDFEMFCQFVAGHSDRRTLEPHVRPQSLLLYGGEIPFDFVGRFEALSHDFSLVTKRMFGQPLELEFQSPSRTNASAQMAEYYTPKILNLVNDVYSEDFKLFDYKKISRL